MAWLGYRRIIFLEAQWKPQKSCGGNNDFNQASSRYKSVVTFLVLIFEMLSQATDFCFKSYESADIKNCAN